MKLVQAVAQARHTATRMLERSAAACSSSSGSLWWRLTAGLLDAKEAESEDSEQSLRKTSELLERALENLCHIFKVGDAPSSFSVHLLLFLHVNLLFLFSFSFSSSFLSHLSYFSFLVSHTDSLTVSTPAVKSDSGESAGLRSRLVPGSWYQ